MIFIFFRAENEQSASKNNNRYASKKLCNLQMKIEIFYSKFKNVSSELLINAYCNDFL